MGIAIKCLFWFIAFIIAVIVVAYIVEYVSFKLTHFKFRRKYGSPDN